MCQANRQVGAKIAYICKCLLRLSEGRLDTKGPAFYQHSICWWHVQIFCDELARVHTDIEVIDCEISFSYGVLPWSFQAEDKYWAQHPVKRTMPGFFGEAVRTKSLRTDKHERRWRLSEQAWNTIWNSTSFRPPRNLKALRHPSLAAPA